MAAVAPAATVEEVDAELAQQWRALLVVSEASRKDVWERIDRLLDERLALTDS
jgi:hypothetical protein